MTDFINLLTNPNISLIRMALLAGIIGSIPFGFIGTFVVVKKMSSIAGAISHSALGGIGLALYLKEIAGIGIISPIGGAMIFAILSATIISIVMNKTTERVDTVIGAVWAVGMSIGILFMSKTPGYIDPMSYLFGNILLIGKSQIINISFFSLIILIFGITFYPQLQAVSFDSEFAETRGINTVLFNTIIMFLIGITLVLMVTFVGAVMVIAFLTIPPAIASMFSKKLSIMIALSILFSIILSTTGLYISYRLNMPTGSVTIVLAGGVYILLRISRSLTQKIKNTI